MEPILASVVFPTKQSALSILAFELLAAIAGYDHRGYKLAPELAKVREVVRDQIPRLDIDRYTAADHQKAR